MDEPAIPRVYKDSSVSAAISRVYKLCNDIKGLLGSAMISGVYGVNVTRPTFYF